MNPISEHDRTALESTSYLLRARERNLQQLAQSSRCRDRAGAELELAKVRAALAATFVELRMKQPAGIAGPRSPRH